MFSSWFQVSTPDPPFKYIAVETAFNAMQSEIAPTIIDVRSKSEYLQGHLMRAINMDMMTSNAVKKEYTLNQLEKRCTSDDLVVAKRRFPPNPIIVYGSDTKTQARETEYLCSLLDEEDSRYRLLIITGGYAGFKDRFPFMTDKTIGRLPHLMDREPYPREIWPNFLYLGGIREVLCLEKVLNITHLVSVGKVEEYIGENEHMKVFAWVVPQFNQCDLQDLFQRTSAFLMEAQTAKGAVLVHDRYGKDIAPTVVLAFLMQHKDMSLAQAFAYVLLRDPLIDPPKGLWAELERYEVFLRGISTLAEVYKLQREHNASNIIN